MNWLLLLHQVPPAPPYLRAKILRRLKQIGALPLKKSAYFLPESEPALEDFQWLLKEIHSDGGEGWILRTEAVAGLTDDSIIEAFRQLRAGDYGELLAETQSLRNQIAGTPSPDIALRKLRKRYDEIARIDFFQAPGRLEVTILMSEIEQTLHTAHQTKQYAARQSPSTGFHGRRWITRRGIKIDRTACSWLILRFVMSLRYRIRVRGWEKLDGLKGPILILPNHPAYIDPALILTTLYPALHPRPLLYEGNFQNPVLYPIMILLDALRVPDLEQSREDARAPSCHSPIPPQVKPRHPWSLSFLPTSNARHTIRGGTRIQENRVGSQRNCYMTKPTAGGLGTRC